MRDGGVIYHIDCNAMQCNDDARNNRMNGAHDYDNKHSSSCMHVCKFMHGTTQSITLHRDEINIAKFYND